MVIVEACTNDCPYHWNELAGRCKVITLHAKKRAEEEMTKSGEARRSVTDGIRNGPPQIILLE